MQVDFKCPDCGHTHTVDADITLRVRDGVVRHMLPDDSFADDCPECGGFSKEVKPPNRTGLASFASRPGGRVCK